MSGTKVTLTWNGKQIEAMATKAMTAGLREAGKLGRKEIRAEIGTKSDSPEGGPPGSVTKNLRKSVTYKVKTRKGKYTLVDIGVLSPSTYDRRAKGKSFKGRMHAQAVRLARGYVGTDRLGRVYSQRGRPFVEPVLKRNRKRLASVVQQTASTYMPKAKVKR